MPIGDLQARLLALCRIDGLNWHLIAREAQRQGGLDRLLNGQVSESGKEAAKAIDALRRGLADLPRYEDEARAAADRAEAAGAALYTVLDDGYPTNLRLVFNLPPFLFVRGQLLDGDMRSVAVVGTRQATQDGLRRADRMARLLAEQRVTVISGLARGVDTAAHSSALRVGSRTIAVIGTGILRCYPRENYQLAEQIAETGALVSQFWPDTPPATYTFPRRNVTMSGMSQGTVVIEASSTSGAKMQARLALEHGKRVYLLRSLVDGHEWARRYASRPGAVVVDNVEDVVTTLLPLERIQAADSRRQQLAIPYL
ncbi:MAG: DNA-protecting protein DprA [Frankia sp.]|nr:DNA-protecting protein DprA [Frankia sp.]